MTTPTSATASRAIYRRGSPGWWRLQVAAAQSAVDVLTENKRSIKDVDAALDRARLMLVTAQRSYRQALTREKSSQSTFDL